jgi:Sec7-like guanine-nucleotide exchange factor
MLGVFQSPDTAYILSFSMIMLNTDLHNAAIPPKKKMSLTQFIKNNSGIDDGKVNNECIFKYVLMIIVYEMVIDTYML